MSDDKEPKRYTLEDYEKLCEKDGLAEAEEALDKLEETRKETNKKIREQKELIAGLKNARSVLYLKANTPEDIDAEKDASWATSLVDYMQSLEVAKLELEELQKKGSGSGADLGPNSDDDNDGDSGVHTSQF